MSDDGFVPGVICGVIIAGLGMTFIVGGIKNVSIDDLKEQATKKGCAEYYMDDKHQAQWRWKN